MKLEQERGISVTSSVMQFEYDGFAVNLLDTPGHEDFSEDTYRTLVAADSAVMLLDNRKGVEERTRQLFEVCKKRRTPIFTFVNKCTVTRTRLLLATPNLTSGSTATRSRGRSSTVRSWASTTGGSTVYRFGKDGTTAPPGLAQRLPPLDETRSAGMSRRAAAARHRTARRGGHHSTRRGHAESCHRLLRERSPTSGSSPSCASS
jgi:hypothetical protein